MGSLYLWIDLGAVVVPLIATMLLPLPVKRHWRIFLGSTLITAFLFIAWDIYFTHKGVWGFNQDYLLGIYIWGLPLEELLFFLCIPWASLFIYFALEYYRPGWLLPVKTSFFLSIGTILLALYLVATHLSRAYTTWALSLLILVLALGFLWQQKLLQRFWLAFLFILIPFFLVNGILTGSMIPAPIVWYNNSENMGLRLFTIPPEDMAYAFSMLFINLGLYSRWAKSLPQNSSL